MTHEETIGDLKSTFSFLEQASPALCEALKTYANVATLPAGTHICLEGNNCTMLPLVKKGTARVYKTSAEGREITLYHIHAGESCILTASCILSAVPFPAFAVTETEVEALVIPTPYFKQWMAEFPEWRNYIFGLLSARFGDVIAMIEEVAFRKMDARLAGYLLGETTEYENQWHGTHETLAHHMGTSREVVSRILKHLEQENKVKLTRGKVRILDRNALQKLHAGGE